MDCKRVEREGIVERYVAGRLGEAEREAFESHFFACDRCFEAVETAGLIRRGFAQMEPKDGVAAHFLRGSGARILAGLAAVLVVAIGVLLTRGLTGSATSSELAELGRVDAGTLPPYVAMTLRSGQTADSAEALFKRGMDAYTTRDFERAADLLQAAVRADSSKAVWHLYLGGSLLAVGRPDDGIDALRVAARERTLASGTDFLLAKAHLQRGRADSAQAALDRVIARGGDEAAEAADLRTQLERIRSP